MKKLFFIVFLLFFSYSYASSLNVVIVPSLCYTNFIQKGISKNEKNKTLISESAFSLGLDIILMEDNSYFTVIFKNCLSFTENTKVHGEIDLINQKGASVIDKIVLNSSLILGYTLDLYNKAQMHFGIGPSLFYGEINSFTNNLICLGASFSITFNYFFIKRLGIGIGIENGLYGNIKDINKVKNIYNRFNMQLSMAIRF